MASRPITRLSASADSMILSLDQKPEKPGNPMIAR